MECSSRHASIDIRKAFAKLEGKMLVVGFLVVVILAGNVALWPDVQ